MHVNASTRDCDEDDCLVLLPPFIDCNMWIDLLLYEATSRGDDGELPPLLDARDWESSATATTKVETVLSMDTFTDIYAMD